MPFRGNFEGEGQLRSFLPALIAAAVATLMNVTGALSLFFTIPLMVAAGKYGSSDRKKFLAPVLTGAAILAVNLIQAREGLSGDEASTVGRLLAISLSIPFVMIACSLAEIATDRKNLFLRTAAGFAVAAVLGGGLMIWIASEDPAMEAAAAYFRDAVDAIYASVTGAAEQNDEFYSYVVMAGSFVAVPVLTALTALSTVIGDLFAARSSLDGFLDLEERTAELKLPDNAVWAFILSWVLVFVNLYFLGNNRIIATVGWNVGLGSSLLYLEQGVAVLADRSRRRAPGRGLRTVMNSIFFLLLPGINIAVAILLAGLGISDIWLRFRERNKGDKSYEDYS